MNDDAWLLETEEKPVLHLADAGLDRPRPARQLVCQQVRVPIDESKGPTRNASLLVYFSVDSLDGTLVLL